MGRGHRPHGRGDHGYPNRTSPGTSFRFTFISAFFLISFLFIGTAPTPNVAASHEVIVTMVDLVDSDRIVPTNNQTEELVLRIDYSDASTGHNITNVSIKVPSNWKITHWAADGDGGTTDYWEDEDNLDSDSWNWLDTTDLVGGEYLNLSAFGAQIISPTNSEDIHIRVITPPGTMSGVTKWTIDLLDDDDDTSTHTIYIAAVDADGLNGYDIGIDVRDGREATFDAYVPVNNTTITFPMVNGLQSPLNTNNDQFPDDPLASDTTRWKVPEVPESGLVVWEDGTDYWSFTLSANYDMRDAANQKEYLVAVYPNTTALSPTKDRRTGGAEDFDANPGTANAVVMYLEKIETFSDSSMTEIDKVFGKAGNSESDVYIKLTGGSQGGGDDSAKLVKIVEVGNPADIVTAAESGVDLRDTGDDGIYYDKTPEPMDISASGGLWTTPPPDAARLRVEGDGDDNGQIPFEYIIMDAAAPIITDISISSDKEPYFFEADTDMQDGNDIVWFNSLAGEGAGQNITINITWTESNKRNISGSQAFGEAPLDTAGPTWSVNYTIKAGNQTQVVIITVRDEAGQSATYTVTFQVDNTDPTPPSNVQARPDGPTDVGEYDDDADIFVTWQNGTDAGAGIKEHRMGNHTLWSNNSVHISGENETGEDGPERFYVYAVDNVGNVAGANDTITIDLYDPVIDNVTISSDSIWFHEADTDMSGDDDKVYLNSVQGQGAAQTITINVSWSDTNMNDTFGQTAFGDTPVDTDEWWFLKYTIEAGATTVSDLKVTVRDKVGRTANYTVDIIVDNMAPDVPDLTIEKDPVTGYDDDGDINASWGAVVDEGIGLSHYQVRIDGGAWADVTLTERSWSNKTEGEHKVEVRAMDLLGNVGGIGNATVIVDLTDPVITDIQVTSTKVSYFFEWDTDMSGGNDKVYFNSIQGEGADQVLSIKVTVNESHLLNITGSEAFGDTPFGLDGIINYTLEAGANTTTITISVMDIVNRSATYKLSIIQDNEDPVVDAGQNLNLRALENHTFDASGATDNVLVAGVVWFFGDGNSSDGAVVSHRYTSRGIYTVLVRATDLVGNVGNDQVNVIVNTGPKMDQIEAQTLYEGSPFELKVIAHDPDGDLLTFEDDTDLFDIGESTGLISFTPTKAQMGDHQVNLRVTDGIAWDSQTVTFRVLSRNAPPVVDGVPDLIITRFNTDYFFDLLPYVWDDEPVKGLEVTVDSEYVKISDTNNLMMVMNYPRSLMGQNQKVTVTVDDGEFKDNDTFTVIIGSNYPPEVVKPLEDQTFPEDSSLTKAFFLTDHFRDHEDITALEYSIFGNKRVLIEVGADHSVNLSADENWFGEELVTIRAYDSGQAFIEDSFLVKVTPVNDPPLFKKIPDLFLRFEEPYNISLTKYLSDVDDPLRTLTVAVSSEYSSISVDNSIVTFLFPKSMNGTKEPVTVTASDGEFEGKVSFNITISDNYPPVLKQELPDVAFEEDSILLGAFNLPDHFTDKDHMELTYQVLWNESVFVTIRPNGNVDLSSAPNFHGVEIIAFRAIDARGAFVDDEIIVTVTPVNDPPTIASIPDQEGLVGRLWRIELSTYINDIDDDKDDLEITTTNTKVTVVGTALLFQYDAPQEDIVVVTVSDGELEDQTSFIVRVKEEPGPKPPTDNQQDLCGVLALLLIVLLILAALIGYMVAAKKKASKEKGGITIEDVKAEVEKAKIPTIVTPSVVAADEPEDIIIGNNYLFEDDGSDKAFRTLHKVCDGQVKGIALSARHPNKLKRKFDLKFVKIYWLSDLKTDVPSLDPGRLDFEIMKRLSDFMKKEKANAVVLLDGVRQMTMATSYEKVLDFLKDVNEVASLNGSTLMVLINPNAYTVKERNQLEEVFDEVRRFTKLKADEAATEGDGGGEGEAKNEMEGG